VPIHVYNTTAFITRQLSRGTEELTLSPVPATEYKMYSSEECHCVFSLY